MVRPASEACFKRAETRSHRGHKACASAAASASSCGRVVSAEIECAGARASIPLVLAACEPCHPRGDPAIAGREFALSEHGELANYGDAVASQPPLHCV